jgi:cysteine synthase
MTSVVQQQICDRSDAGRRAWVAASVRLLEADAQRSSDTHLLKFPLPAGWDVDLYVKDESTHITGSLKHRLARSLFLYALCNGWVGPETTVVEASSGSTAVSEAYFARLIGVPFVAVMTATTSPDKIALIESYGGRCSFVDDPAKVYGAAADIAAEVGGHYMDQFTYAERATDWRGNNNIAESMFSQLRYERFPEPAWVVCAAGTGGTSATIGRYLRYRSFETRLCVPDPVGSAFLPAWRDGDPAVRTAGSHIEGIGRPRVEPSFVGSVIDRMLPVTDAESVAMMREVDERWGRRVGPSTGTNLWACLQLIGEMRAAGESGSVVTVLCDAGDRYRTSYHDPEWVAAQGWDCAPAHHRIRAFLAGESDRL